MKKILSILLSIIVLNGVMILPVSAADNSVVTDISKNSIVIDAEQLPTNGEPLVLKYPIGSNDSVQSRNSSYIVFSITRSSVNWWMASCPDSWIFSGTMNITNITTGFSCGTGMSMYGRSGSFGYGGLSGHLYRFYFSGKILSNGSIISNHEESLHAWQVPFD